MKLSDCSKCGGWACQGTDFNTNEIAITCTNKDCGQEVLYDGSETTKDEAAEDWNARQELMLEHPKSLYDGIDVVIDREVLLDREFSVTTENNGYVLFSRKHGDNLRSQWVFNNLQDLADFIKLHGPDTLDKQ